jgi:hypothetical protein
MDVLVSKYYSHIHKIPHFAILREGSYAYSAIPDDSNFKTYLILKNPNLFFIDTY